jgi:Flp pilus assembly protein TadD
MRPDSQFQPKEPPMSRSSAMLLIFLLLLCGCAGLPNGRVGESGPGSRADSAALLAAADATRADGRFGEALQIYQQQLVADQNSAAGQYGMAESLLGLARAGEAKPLFLALAKQGAFHARALQGMGIADLALRKYEEAGKSLREAVNVDATLWRAYNALGLMADMKRQRDEAASLYDTALEINPDSAVVLNNRGYSRLGAGKTDLALADFRQALALDPGSETIQNNLRIAIAAQGNYQEATRSLAQGQQAVVLNNVGFIAMQRGDLTAAEAFLARAMAAGSRYEAVTAKNLQQVTSLKADSK